MGMDRRARIVAGDDDPPHWAEKSCEDAFWECIFVDISANREFY